MLLGRQRFELLLNRVSVDGSFRWIFFTTFPVFHHSNANKVQASSDAEQTNHFSPSKIKAVGKPCLRN